MRAELVEARPFDKLRAHTVRGAQGAFNAGALSLSLYICALSLSKGADLLDA